MSSSALATYARSAAATASPHQIVRMAYERVITACDRCERAAGTRGDRWIETFNDEAIRAQAILIELTSGLAMKSEDPAVVDLATHLGDLYMFAIEQLGQANVRKSTTELDAVRMIIDGLRDAWVQIG